MFEAKLAKAGILKKIMDAIKDLVNESNFECSAEGISLQAMDNSHVALVSLLLKSDGFEHYRCDKTLSLGINLANLSKIMKSAESDDTLTLRADDNGDKLSLVFESPSKKTEPPIVFFFELLLFHLVSYAQHNLR